MVLDSVANFVRGSTDAAVDSTQTTVSVVDASIFPDPSTDGEYNVVVWDAEQYPRPDQDPDVEVLRVTAVDTGTNDLTVTRGQEGTAGASHPSGSAIQLSPTAKMFTDIESTFGDFWDATNQELTAAVNNNNVTTESATIKQPGPNWFTTWPDANSFGFEWKDGTRPPAYVAPFVDGAGWTLQSASTENEIIRHSLLRHTPTSQGTTEEIIGRYRFEAIDSSGGGQRFAMWEGVGENFNDGSERGRMEAKAMNNGAMVNPLAINPFSLELHSSSLQVTSGDGIGVGANAMPNGTDSITLDDEATDPGVGAINEGGRHYAKSGSPYWVSNSGQSNRLDIPEYSNPAAGDLDTGEHAFDTSNNRWLYKTQGGTVHYWSSDGTL